MKSSGHIIHLLENASNEKIGERCGKNKGQLPNNQQVKDKLAACKEVCDDFSIFLLGVFGLGFLK